jgi:hypothetical protein
MEQRLKEYIFKRQGKLTDYDEFFMEKIIKNMEIENDNLYLDCHGLYCDELKYFLEFLDDYKKNMKIRFITGWGKNSKKPKMDYFCEKIWNCPLKQTIINYYVKTKRGAGIRVGYSHITIRLRY